MNDLMKLLDTKLHRMRVVKSQLPDSELGVMLKDSKRGPLVNFEQVKTVVGQWLADQKPKLDSTRRLVDQWFAQLDDHPEIEFDDMDALERLIQAEVERRVKEAKGG